MPFVYSPQVVRRLEAALSSERLARYVAAGGGIEAGIQLYAWNCALSEALYTPLQGLEVALRNALGEKLKQAYGSDWFELDPGPPITNPLVDMVKAACEELRKRGRGTTHGRVTAELNLGFWTGLLAKRHETSLWRPHFRAAFPGAPNPLLRKEVFSRLDQIRRLRNRIAHHEPIFVRDGAGDHAAILELIGWICPTTRDWVAHQSRVPSVLAQRP